MDYNYSSSSSSINSSMSKRRHSLPSSPFVDPAIVRFIERASIFDQNIFENDDLDDDLDDDEMDDQRTTITTVSLPQNLEHNHKSMTNNTTTKLNQLLARQIRYDDLELRLLSLEVTKKRFEHRLQELESNAFNKTIILQQQQQQQQPMKPDQQPTTTTTTTTRRVLQGNMIHCDNRLTENQTHDKDDDNNEMVIVTNQKYMELLHKHESLINKYNATQIEFEEKEKYYKQKIQELSVENNNYKKELKQEEEEPSYKEEDGYLIFDTTNMNGEIIHCKVKIPTPSMALASPPATRVSSPQYQSPLTPLPSNHHFSPKKNKGLNFNAPEWKSTSINTFTTNRSL